MRPTRLVAWGCFLVFAALAVNVFARSRSPLATIGGWATDHVSHTSSTVLFAHRGFAIYGEKIASLCPRIADPEPWVERYGVPKEMLCNPEGRVAARPLAINWPRYPRSYPPGANLFAAPEALLHAHTSAPFHAINQVTVVKYLAIALIAFFLFFLLARDRLGQEPVLWIALGVVFTLTVQLSLTGFYDCIALAFLFLAVLLLREERPAWAAAACAAALFFHYRAVWYWPLGVWALIQHFRGQPLSAALGRRFWLPLGTALALVAIALVTFAMSAADIAAFPVNNPLRVDRGVPVGAWDVVLLEGLAVAWMMRERAWLPVAVALSQVVILWLTPEIRPWHSTMVLGLLAVGFVNGSARVRIALIAICLVQLLAVFNATPLPGYWLDAMWTGDF